MRRADPGARRRLARGSVGLQRREAGARHRRLADSGDLRRRPRDRLHHRRFRRRCAGADALRGGGAGRARRRGMARGLARLGVRLRAVHAAAPGRAAASGCAGSRGRAAQVSPVARLAQQTQRLDELEQRMSRAMQRRLRGPPRAAALASRAGRRSRVPRPAWRSSCGVSRISSSASAGRCGSCTSSRVRSISRIPQPPLAGEPAGAGAHAAAPPGGARRPAGGGGARGRAARARAASAAGAHLERRQPARDARPRLRHRHRRARPDLAQCGAMPPTATIIEARLAVGSIRAKVQRPRDERPMRELARSPARAAARRHGRARRRAMRAARRRARFPAASSSCGWTAPATCRPYVEADGHRALVLRGCRRLDGGDRHPLVGAGRALSREGPRCCGRARSGLRRGRQALHHPVAQGRAAPGRPLRRRPAARASASTRVIDRALSHWSEPPPATLRWPPPVPGVALELLRHAPRLQRRIAQSAYRHGHRRRRGNAGDPAGRRHRARYRRLFLHRQHRPRGSRRAA